MSKKSTGISTLILSLLIGSIGYAQDFKPLFIAGVNGSQIDGDTLSGYDKGGLYLGIGLMYEVSKNQ